MKIVIEIPDKDMFQRAYYTDESVRAFKEAVQEFVDDTLGWQGVPFIVTMQEEG